MSYKLTFDVLWQTKKFVPFRMRELPVQFISEQDEQPPTVCQVEVLTSIDTLTTALIPVLTTWAKMYYRTVAELFPLAEYGITIGKTRLEQQYTITEIVVPRLSTCTTNYLFLCGECDWDSEHGIEFLLANGSPIRCNAQEGLALSEEWDDYLRG